MTEQELKEARAKQIRVANLADRLEILREVAEERRGSDEGMYRGAVWVIEHLERKYGLKE